MIHTNLPVFLASKSPRRRKLLTQIGISFKAFSVDLEEEFFDGESPVNTVKRLSLYKMEFAKKKIKSGIIITADTVVALDNKLLGKPETPEDAVKMLKTLSGKTHKVYTGYTIYNSEKDSSLTDYEKTLVTFNELNDNDIEEYVASGSPMDKAGAYGIQDDFGAVFVKKINGCYYNVVGFPLSKFYASLKEII